MRSFASSAKSEICRDFPQDHCCALAECFGVFLFCNSFQSDCIKIITENGDFAFLLPKLLKKAFSFGFDSSSGEGEGTKNVFLIHSEEKIRAIMSAFGFDSRQTLSLHINYPIIENDCCKAAFLRGAFLAGGSVTDPAKGYHLEIGTTHQSVSRECFSLIQESMNLDPKLSARAGGHVVYFKNSEQISDILAYLGASVASMGIIEARLEKELNNRVNRRCNCDDANISKVVEASQEQLNAIRILKEHNCFESLPEKLKQAARAREENPEAALTELAGLMNPPISKPAMSHRLKRLTELAKETEK